MSKKMKIVSGILLLILILISGVVYFASTKLNPEEIRKIAIAQSQKIFPKATVSLESVEIGWGLNFKIGLKKFTLSTKSEDGAVVEMMSVDDFDVKVPLWAIITDGGIIEIQLDRPIMNYAEFPTGNNWTYAMGDKPKEDVQAKPQEAGAGDTTAAIGLFGKSKINVRLSDVAVKYKLRDNSNGQISVSRFLVKGLNFETSTAFEIASNAKFMMADKSVVSFSTLAIGEINIADLVKNGSVSSLVIVKVNNIAKTGLEWKFPEITTNINMLLKKDGEISGKIESSFESQNKISANFKMTKEIEISNIAVDIILKDVGLIIGLDRSIDLSSAKLNAKGSVLYSSDKKINANVSFSLSPGVGYSKDGLSAITAISGSFKEKDIDVKIKTDVLGGTVETLVSGEFDPNQKFDIKNLNPFDIKITASKLKIPEKLIQEKLWAKKDPAVLASEEAARVKLALNTKTEEKPAPGPMIPPANVLLSWNNILVGSEDFSGKGKIILSAQSLAIDDLNFKFSKGSGRLTQTMKLGVKSSESVFDMGITDLNLSSFKPFLPPFVENFSGVFSGKVNGSATIFKSQKPPAYDVNVLVDAKKGEIKKLNISEYINPLLENIPMVKDQVKDKQVKLDGNFETLNMKGRFTNATYNITSFNFIGLNKKVEMTGSGTIYPLPGSSSMSSMEVNLTENGKVGDLLLKNIGSKILPIKVSGPGFAMKPEYQYTLSKIAKGALKTKGKEAAQKIIEKNIDKLVPEKAREKVKGLLDGFFKKK